MTYRIVRELGSGAIGRVVELADDDGHRWAGKILHKSQEADERARRRFEAEARLLEGIAHPNLIAVYGLVEVEGGERALCMELVGGSDLAHLIATDAPLPAARVIELGRGIAAGLGEAHRAGLVHRDLKPANVLLAEGGAPKVADFGLARAASFAASDPDSIAVAGTPDYMAPESADPLAIDARSDLYALGCILCELATGAPPYRGATAFAVLQAHREAPLPALSEVPDGLRRVIRWLLAKSPADRPQSATEVERALAADPGVALELAGAAPNTRACARCGAVGPSTVRVCFACGEPQLEPAKGNHTVFVTGPGETVHKLDAVLRQRLIEWISANPALGLDARDLAREVPRLPFPLVVAIDPTSAKALVAALRDIGIEAQAMKGGRFAHPGARTKAWTLAGRMAMIGIGGSFYALRQSVIGMGIATVVVGTVSLFRGFVYGSRPVTQLRGGRTVQQLPSSLDAALARVAQIVPAMAALRHRDSLRGVVERTLALRDALEPKQRAAMEADLAQLVDRAALAASRLDQLEAELSPDDLRSGDEAKRARWLARDRWSGAILQTTAFLDAMRARAGMAKARGLDASELDALRAQTEALQELA